MRRKLRSALWNHKLPLRVPEDFPLLNVSDGHPQIFKVRSKLRGISVPCHPNCHPRKIVLLCRSHRRCYSFCQSLRRLRWNGLCQRASCMAHSDGFLGQSSLSLDFYSTSPDSSLRSVPAPTRFRSIRAHASSRMDRIVLVAIRFTSVWPCGRWELPFWSIARGCCWPCRSAWFCSTASSLPAKNAISN